MTWSAGAVLTAAQLNTYLPQAWSTYTPTRTGFTVSAQEARYIQFGKFVIVNYTATLNAAVTATMSVSLPVPARATAGPRLPIGTVMGLDAGTGRRIGQVVLTPSAAIEFWIDNTVSAWTVTQPFTWASTDEIGFSCFYEAA
jgi:hypothetical protein